MRRMLTNRAYKQDITQYLSPVLSFQGLTHMTRYSISQVQCRQATQK